MFHCLEVHNHRAFLTGSRDVKVHAVPSKPRMTVAVNVRHKRMRLKVFAERAAPNVRVPQPRIEDPQGRTVRHEDCCGVTRRRQVSKVGFDVGVRLFKRPTHERQ